MVFIPVRPEAAFVIPIALLVIRVGGFHPVYLYDLSPFLHSDSSLCTTLVSILIFVAVLVFLFVPVAFIKAGKGCPAQQRSHSRALLLLCFPVLSLSPRSGGNNAVLIQLLYFLHTIELQWYPRIVHGVAEPHQFFEDIGFLQTGVASFSF